MSGVFTATYEAQDQERLCDVCAGICMARRRIRRKKGGAVRPITALLRRARVCFPLWFVITAAQVLGMVVWGTSPLRLLLAMASAGICARYGILGDSGQRAYRDTLAYYRENVASGRLRVDGNGFTRVDRQGRETAISWQAYGGCALSGEAVVLFDAAGAWAFPCTAELEEMLRRALAAYGKADTLWPVTVRGKGEPRR